MKNETLFNEILEVSKSHPTPVIMMILRNTIDRYMYASIARNKKEEDESLEIVSLLSMVIMTCALRDQGYSTEDIEKEFRTIETIKKILNPSLQ